MKIYKLTYKDSLDQTSGEFYAASQEALSHKPFKKWCEANILRHSHIVRKVDLNKIGRESKTFWFSSAERNEWFLTVEKIIVNI